MPSGSEKPPGRFLRAVGRARCPPYVCEEVPARRRAMQGASQAAPRQRTRRGGKDRSLWGWVPTSTPKTARRSRLVEVNAWS